MKNIEDRNVMVSCVSLQNTVFLAKPRTCGLRAGITFRAMAARFADQERALLLKQRGIGIGTLRRLEAAGCGSIEKHRCIGILRRPPMHDDQPLAVCAMCTLTRNESALPGDVFALDSLVDGRDLGCGDARLQRWPGGARWRRFSARSSISRSWTRCRPPWRTSC